MYSVRSIHLRSSAMGANSQLDWLSHQGCRIVANPMLDCRLMVVPRLPIRETPSLVAPRSILPRV